MEMLNNETLIVGLIKDSLIHTKLILGLDSIGLNADNYSLFLGEKIFALMAFESGEYSDMVFERVYAAMVQNVRSIDLTNSEELDLLSKDIYKELQFAKKISISKQEPEIENELKNTNDAIEN